jgi:predicted signal transduction protein with EAL and GGDEF domain
MNKDEKYWLIVGTLIVVAVLATLWATSTSWFPRHPWDPRRPPENILSDVELFYTVGTVVSTVNLTLSIFLLFIYIGIYQKTRSEFTIGLVIFSAVFLLNALASNPLFIRAFGFWPVGLGPFAMLSDLFTLAALAVLLYLSVKY